MCVIVYRIRIGITFEIGISSLQNNSAVWLSLQSYSGNLSPGSMLIHCRCYATCLTKIEAQHVSYQCPFTHPVRIKFMWWTTTLGICLNYILFSSSSHIHIYKLLKKQCSNSLILQIATEMTQATRYMLARSSMARQRRAYSSSFNLI